MRIDIIATVISVLKELIGFKERFEKTERDRCAPQKQFARA